MKKEELKKKVKDAEEKVKKKVKPKEKGEKKKGWKSVLNIILVIAIAVISLALAFLLYIVITSPDFNKENLYQKEPTILYDINGKEFARVGEVNSTILTYDEIPDVLIDALLATEDSRFFQHNGIDLARFIKASLYQLIGKNYGGASTIDMQLMKQKFNGKEDEGLAGIIRKFKDIYMSVFKLEANYTKEEILEFYFNSLWFANAGDINIGDGIWGIEEASQYYFGKSARDINLAEASLLVGMFQNPVWYNPYSNAEGCRIRQTNVLKYMVRHGYITEEQKDAVLEIPVETLLIDQTKQRLKVETYQAFVDFVIKEVQDEYDIDARKVALKIYTTYDPELQAAVEKVEKGEVYKFPSETIQEGIAITSTDTGALLAMSGGRNYQANGTNFALTKRQPGSTAKPIMDYGPYIEYLNHSSYAQVNDNYTLYRNSTSSISNYDNGHKGIITIRYGLSDSRNVPALKVFRQVYDKDKKLIENFAHSLGIDYGSELIEPASIGGGTIQASPLQMSAAYGAFARGGYYIEPYAYTRIYNTETEKEYTHSYTKEKIMEESSAFMLTSILDDVYGSDHFKDNKGTVGSDGIAGKTGTTNLSKADKTKYNLSSGAILDSWYITYSSKYAIAFWYGFEDLNKQSEARETENFNFTSGTGGTARTSIMKNLAKLHKGCKKFEMPKDVVKTQVEIGSYPYQLPSEYTPDSLKRYEYFLEGTEPTEVSKRFSTLDNPKNGKYNYSGNVITLSWDPIKTPDAINPTYLLDMFTDYVGKEEAQGFYDDRIKYNNNNIGNLNYVIYLRDANGNDTRIGSTTSNTFNYLVSAGGDYTFVVKAEYTIFAKNASTGLVISTRTIDSNVNDMVDNNNNNNNTQDNNNNADIQNNNDNQDQNQNDDSGDLD